jgi:glutamate:GABA antiporter
LSSDSKPLFLRQATGLTREFGVFDAIWTNLGLVGIFFSLTFIASTAPLLGGNPLNGGLIALAGMFFVALTFAAISIVTPRTASDYVFTSRYLHPALGFVGNAGYYVSTIPLFMGITITTIESFGFSSLFGYVGLQTNNNSLVSLASALTSNPYYMLALGGGLTIVFGLIPFAGYKVYKALNNIILPLILIAVAVMFYVLATTPTQTALTRLAQLTGNPNLVANVTSIQAAVPAPPAHGLTNDFALNAVYVVGFSYIISAIYIAGEVKQVKKNMPIAIIGTLAITLVIFAGATLLSYQTFGYQFLSNLYNGSYVPGYATFGFPIFPYLDFLAAAISNNVYIGSFIIIVCIIQLLWYQTNAVFVGGRLLLSYSFDRIMPGFMGSVSDRFHVPAKAMIVSLVIGLLAGVIFVAPATTGVAFAMSAAAVAIILIFPITVVGIALIVFRVNKKADYNASLGSFGPLYLLSAVITIVYALATFVEYIITPTIFPVSSLTFGLELIFVPIAVLFAIYYIAKAINASRGVKFDLIFKEIPPE